MCRFSQFMAVLTPKREIKEAAKTIIGSTNILEVEFFSLEEL